MKKKKGPTAWDLAGFIKGGKPFNSAKETDKIVYMDEYEKIFKQKKRRKK